MTRARRTIAKSDIMECYEMTRSTISQADCEISMCKWVKSCPVFEIQKREAGYISGMLHFASSNYRALE